MKIQTMFGIVTGILILIGSLRCLKEAKTIDMILGKSKLQNIFLIFSNMLLVHIEIAS